MSVRKKLAGAGLALFALHLASAATGGDSLLDRLSVWISPEQLLSATVRLELGNPRPAEDAGPEAIVLSSPSPSPEPESEPALSATPAPEDPSVTADGLPIVATTITGGLTLKNETDYDIDIQGLLRDGPATQLPADQPQILIIHTHSSEAYTPAGADLYAASDTCRTEDTNYNIVRVGDVLTASFENAGLNVLHDRTIYDYPSYTGSYSRSGDAILSYLEQYPSIRIVIDLHRDALCSDSVVYKTVAEIPDTACSQVMILCGTDSNGLYHPYWKDNLRLAVYMQNAVNEAHPTLMRPITLVNERYNQHLTTGSLIVEVGSSGNTLQEAINAVQLFGDSAGPALAKLIS